MRHRHRVAWIATVESLSRALLFRKVRSLKRTFRIHQLSSTAAIVQQCSTIQLPPFSHRTLDNEILFSIHFIVQVFVTGECFNCYYGGGQCATNSRNNFRCSTSTAPKGVLTHMSL